MKGRRKTFHDSLTGVHIDVLYGEPDFCSRFLRKLGPICYWAILMSGHVPLLLDSQYELFHYRTMNECSGIYCITNDKNYPNIISPDFIKNSHSEVDSAYFDQLWANETIIVNEKNDGSLQAISHD